MFKLLITAITWLFFSSGSFNAPATLVTFTDAGKAETAAVDTHCNRSEWPDRARACTTSALTKDKFTRNQGIEKLADLRPDGPAVMTSGVQFYDANASAAPVKVEEAPVAAAAPEPAGYALAGTTTEAPKPLTRTFRPVAAVSADADDEAAPTIERRRPAARTAPRRNMGMASYRPQGMTRVLGTAF